MNPLLSPLWAGNEVLNESLLPVRDAPAQEDAALEKNPA